jgi:hypothetical protein
VLRETLKLKKIIVESYDTGNEVEKCVLVAYKRRNSNINAKRKGERG